MTRAAPAAGRALAALAPVRVRVPVLVAVAVVALLSLAVAVPPAAAKKAAQRTPAELTNVFLSPEWSKWMVGPIGRMATEEEVETWLGLTDDAEALAFVRGFWTRRDPDPETPFNPVHQLYQERAEEADRLYREAGQSGRRTDRGTIHVLYGEPEETEYELLRPEDPPVETWRYPRDAEPGLDGEEPERRYRFVKRGDLTVFYTKRVPNRLLRDGRLR